MMSLRSFIVNIAFTILDGRRDKHLKLAANVIRHKDIVYGVDDKMQSLDIYHPRDMDKKLPVIVNVHGGGFVYGTKETYQYYCSDLAKRGFIVVSFSYRLAPKHRFPKQLEDINLVMKWVKEHQERYLMDLHHLYLIGDSAGAHLSLLYTSFLVNKPYQDNFAFKPAKGIHIKALSLSCGIYDIHKIPWHTYWLFRDLLGKDFKRYISLVNPIAYVTDDFPPIHLMSFNADFLKMQIPLLKTKLNEFNVMNESQIYGDKKHRLGHVFHTHVDKLFAIKANDDQCDFLKQH